MNKILKIVIPAMLVAVLATSASAVSYTFVGSWRVDAGPNWPTVPPAYSGQSAAALLFGGSPGDYAISTIDSDPANIDFLSWVSTWDSGGLGLCGGAFPCGTKIAQGAVTSTGGLYQNPGDTSAYVNDWAVGAEYTNYAFTVSRVPVPAAATLLPAAIGVLAFVRRRRKAA